MVCRVFSTLPVKQAVAICVADHAGEEASIWKRQFAAFDDPGSGSGTRHLHSASVLRSAGSPHASQGEEQLSGMAWIRTAVDPGSKVALSWLIILTGHFTLSDWHFFFTDGVFYSGFFINGLPASRAAHYGDFHGCPNEGISIAATGAGSAGGCSPRGV